ncbi:MAG: peptidylprolyl isomerase [Gilvibacter sp.]
MKNLPSISLVLIAILALVSCNSKTESSKTEEAKPTQIEMVTTKGTILLELYDETPLHRDNFIKLAQEKAFDSLLFHRVMQQFMVQGGDPDSKGAKPGVALGSGDLEYMVDAEFRPSLFHKKGALAAARDGNLARASSAMQFYIVQGKVYNDSLLELSQNRINEWLGEHYFKNKPESKPLLDAMDKAQEEENRALWITLNDSIKSLAKAYDNFDHYTIPQDHREVYKSIGGAPFLDQNYTVYGEVLKGLEVVDSIAATPVDERNRPFSDVMIISVRVVEQ